LKPLKPVVLTFLVACIFLENVKVAAQKINYLEFTAGTGKLVKNYPQFPVLENPAFILSCKYSQLYNGYKPWHKFYRYPVAGISFTAGTLGNRKILGNFAGISAELAFNKRITDKLYWSPQLALGSAFFSSPFDEENNPANIVIGSRFAFFASAHISLAYSISHKIDLFTKLSVLHASNSHFRLPNVGMNLPAAALGVRYNFNEHKTILPDTFQTQYSKAIRFHIRTAVGINEQGASTGPVNGPKYPVFIASCYLSRQFSPVNKVSAGIEGWYNAGVYDYIVSQDFYEEHRSVKSTSVALVFGHEFLAGHWGLLTTGGIYLYNPFYKERLKRNNITGIKDQLKARIPARLGIQYYLKNTFYHQHNNLFAGIYIKTNFGQADFLETGIGYMF
jgi:hypothetical protein